VAKEKYSVKDFVTIIPVAVGDWIMKPELSTAHLGIGSGFTARKSTIATAVSIWLCLASQSGRDRKTSANAMDRSRCEPSHFYCGSSQSLLSRNYRGGAENHYADKTNWRKMLTVEQIDLVAGD
jgi:hypothetical protein